MVAHLHSDALQTPRSGRRRASQDPADLRRASARSWTSRRRCEELACRLPRAETCQRFVNGRVGIGRHRPDRLTHRTAPEQARCHSPLPAGRSVSDLQGGGRGFGLAAERLGCCAWSCVTSVGVGEIRSLARGCRRALGRSDDTPATTTAAQGLKAVLVPLCSPPPWRVPIQRRCDEGDRERLSSRPEVVPYLVRLRRDARWPSPRAKHARTSSP